MEPARKTGWRMATGDDGIQLVVASQYVGDQFLVALGDHQIEKTQAILGEGFGMGASDDGDGPLSLVELGEGVAKGAVLGVDRDEYQVQIGGQFAFGVAHSVEGSIVHLVSQLTGPHSHSLGHDAGILLGSEKVF